MQEFDAIARYFRPLARSAGALGLGDDVARLATSGPGAIVTVDCLVEGVHFLPGDPIDTVARKLVRVNVSDIHAKGALPKEALLVLGWPSGRDERDLQPFAAALGSDLDAWGATLIGGDTVTSPGPLFLSLTLTGESIGPAPVQRSGARPGDELWVTGEIGAGWCGLRDVRLGQEGGFAGHYRVPDLPGAGGARLVAAFGSASMDVSDGLLGDAAKLGLESGVRVELDRDAVPLASPVDGVMEQLTGGDDYQILFTAPASVHEDLTAAAREFGVKLSRIGAISAGAGLGLVSMGQAVKLPENLGFAHE